MRTSHPPWCCDNMGVYTHTHVCSSTVFDPLLGSTALDLVRSLCACVCGSQQGPPQKPQQAETEPEPDPSLIFVEPRSHGPTVSMNSIYAWRLRSFLYESASVAAYWCLFFSSFKCQVWEESRVRARYVSITPHRDAEDLRSLPPPSPSEHTRRSGPSKAPTRALSLHVSTQLCNETCLGTAPLTLLMIWTSCSCHFLLDKLWRWRRLTASNYPGRSGKPASVLREAVGLAWRGKWTTFTRFF